MVYKHYTWGLLQRVAIIVIASFLLGYIISTAQLHIVLLVFCILFLVLSIYILMRYMRQTNEQITYFIHAIKNDDTTLRFPKKTGNKTIDELHRSLNELNIILQEMKQKSRIKERYFSEILQNIATGVIVYNEKGFVTDVNPAALEILGLQVLTHLKQIDRTDISFRKYLESFCGGNKEVVNMHRKDEIIQLVVRCSVIKLKNEEVRLLTMQDIHGELERKEIDSWIKLIRVLSHEIMNSLTPVTSITQSLQRLWRNKLNNPKTIDDDIVESTISGLDVIGERGNALIRFVQSYRMLSKVPTLNIQQISVSALFDRLNILTSPFRDEFPSTSFHFKYPTSDFMIAIDEQMIVQLIINLVKNSFESTYNQPDGRIDVECRQLQTGNFQLSIVDNGPGIPDELLDEIFVPFFTTKTEGTGVGLSYSRQIVRAHGGTLKCSSQPGRTVFRVEI